MTDLVIVPIYNEIETIESVLASIRLNHDGDILVVDDGSTDGSSELLGRIDGINIIRHKINSGYGKSLIDGFEYASRHGYKRMVTIDCDLQHEPKMIPSMFGMLGENDVLSGSRYLEENKTDDHAPESRKRVNRIITKEINNLTGLSLTDAFCGFKCYLVSAVARLDLDETGYAMPLQFWLESAMNNLKVEEIAVPRIYKNMNRSFGEKLDDPDIRLIYYRKVINREVRRWSTCCSSGLTRTT